MDCEKATLMECYSEILMEIRKAFWKGFGLEFVRDFGSESCWDF